MKVGDLVQPVETLSGWEHGTESWIGLVSAVGRRDSVGVDIATVRWNREGFQAEEEYCHHLKIINES